MRNGWIMLLVLICVAFLVSCGKKSETASEKGELVQVEVREDIPGLSFFGAPLSRIRNRLFLYCPSFADMVYFIFNGICFATESHG